MPLSDITILITSFLRPGYLKDCLRGIADNLPECKIAVVDDGEAISDGSIFDGISCSLNILPFDSGLPAKRNAGVKACTTKYLLMGSDDFDFSTCQVRDGIELMTDTLDYFSDIDVAGGRHNNTVYEGDLEYVPGQYIREHRLVEDEEDHLFYNVDLTCNYFLARTKRILPWDERMKIGGEHGDWFLEMKQQNRRTVYVPGANINALPYDAAKQHPDYAKYRSRAKDLGHKIFKEKRNIIDYIGFDGGKS